LNGWDVDSRYSNAGYVLDSSSSGISLDLDATGLDSMVTVVKWDLPQLVLSEYSYMDVAVTGSSNALCVFGCFWMMGRLLRLRIGRCWYGCW